MSAPRPVYVIGSPSAARDVLAAAAVPALRTLDHPDGIEELEPGIAVFVRRGLEPEALLSALLSLGRGRGEWTPVVAEDGPDGPVLRALSVGYPHPPEALGGLAREDDPLALLELRRLVAEVSMARHDINNPLTSGMAETQLLLMDAPPAGELRESLETIQVQLRRIRDLVAGLSHVRHQEEG